MIAAAVVAAATSCSGPPSASNPDVRSFAQARAAIENDIAADVADATISIAGRSRLYDHGRPVTHAVLLFHGFTNAPQQFDELARELYARGSNVYVPRIPHHGKKDRLTQDLVSLSVAELQGFSERAFDLLRPLGSRTTVLGLSLGGTLTMWLAQTQPVDLAIPVAPFLMPYGWTRGVGGATMRAAQLSPDFYWWWDARVLENTRPAYAYPGYPIHALAQVTFLGDAIFDLASRLKPLARRCTLVSNVDDTGINNDVSRALLTAWQQHGAPYQELVLHDLGQPRHDIIDPTTFPAARTLVYPKLTALATS
jgi:pimeloyl-ACP methyl ester carboxylesterase